MDVKEAKLQDGRLLSRHPWELARLAAVRAILRDQVSELASPGTVVLDVGCGDAFVAAALAEDYPASRFVAVDQAFTPSKAEELARHIALPNLSLHPSVEETALAPGSIGLMLLLDVLEHVKSDAGFLKDLTEHLPLAAGATVLITVPAFGFLFGAHDRSLGHYRRYDMGNLRQVVATARLEAVEDGFFFATLVLPRLMSVLWQRIRPSTGGTSGGVGRWRGGPMLTGLLRAVLFADFHLCRIARRCGVTLPGLSCYAICRKQAS
ncbi:MAG: class I SAM-dependent methyltransferase [Candidatus Brocadiae bacterium]|nr:class I SAM-dependent methyltransferase [Candidatus Brocadiia bacterium]